MDPTQVTPAHASKQPDGSVSIRFTGSGSEYFRIWIINLLLCLVTFGIYLPWAKVRRVKYFYSNTLIDGSSLDYHGSPHTILKGWIVVSVGIGITRLIESYYPLISSLLIVLFSLSTPIFVVQSMRFKLRNTSYRGLRFVFHGKLKDAIMLYSIWPMLVTLSLGLLVPLWHKKIQHYIASNSAFGQTKFSLRAQTKAFYSLYFKCLCFTVVVGIAAVSLSGLIVSFFPSTGAIVSPALLFLGIFGIVTPLFIGYVQNTIWNNLTLGEISFSSTLSVNELTKIMLRNLLLTVLTLGLYRPFAKIVLMKYRLESISIIPAVALDNFVADQQEQASAIGEETAEWLGLDFSF